jgi:hypothetical protein
VTWPAPQLGLVIRYSYLWTREARAGREEGAKDRPCAIVLAIGAAQDRKRIIVLPITHTTPQPSDEGIELPPRGQDPPRAGSRALLGHRKRGQRLHLARSRFAPSGRWGVGRRRLWLSAAKVVPRDPEPFPGACPNRTSGHDPTDRVARIKLTALPAAFLLSCPLSRRPYRHRTPGVRAAANGPGGRRLLLGVHPLALGADR